MNVIIVGCGRVGAELARILAQDGHNVTILDTNADAFGRLADGLQVKTVVGSGTDMDTLEEIGIREADAFAAVTNGDNRNIMAAQIAQRIFNVNQVVCRIYDPLRQQTYRLLGLHSISPTIVGAKLMRNEIYGVDPRAQSSDRQRVGGQPTPPVAGQSATQRH